VIRWGTVSGVAVGATVLATGWGVGGQVTVAGPPAVRPDRLMAQHTATAGELPFWGSTATGSATSSAGPAVSLLRRAAQASATTSYRGVELVMTSEGSAPHTEVADVSHFADRGTSTLVVGSGAGAGTADFRPEGATATSAALDAVSLLDKSYVLIPEGPDEVAGRDADRVAVYTPSGELAARFWIDRESGLPLAREVRDGNGAAAEVSVFTTVTVGDPSVMPDHLPVASNVTWADAATGTAPDALEAQGWVCPDDLAEETGLTAFDARISQTAGSAPVLHLVLTDGLRSLSVFQQRASLTATDLDGFATDEVGGRTVYRKAGTPTLVAWASGPTVFTVVGDADQGAVDGVVAALPHDPVATGSRTGRGFARVGSWLDPFG